MSFVTDGSNSLPAALSRSSIRLGALSAARQFPAMAGAPVATDSLKAADVSCNHTAQVTFHIHFILQNMSDCRNVLIGQVFGANFSRNFHFLDDFESLARTDAVDVAQSKFNALLPRNFYSNYSWNSL